MLRFKQFIKERAPAWTESLSTMLFDLRAGSRGIDELPIPMSPPIFKRIWPDSIRSRVFHLTDFTGVHKLKKMQGKKKSISAFYNMEPSRMVYGIKTEGGYVVEMDADILAAAPDDIASMPDKTGRRWLIWDTVLNDMGGGSKIKKMEKDLIALIVEIQVKYAEDPNPYNPTPVAGWVKLGKEYKSDGKGKSLIIKDYLDGMEKIMKKYSKPLRSIFTDYTKKRIQDPDEDSGEVEDWDELVVNNFKIIKIHVGPEYAEDFQDDDDIDGFPFQTWNDDAKLSDHITKIVKKGK